MSACQSKCRNSNAIEPVSSLYRLCIFYEPVHIIYTSLFPLGICQCSSLNALITLGCITSSPPHTHKYHFTTHTHICMTSSPTHTHTHTYMHHFITPHIHTYTHTHTHTHTQEFYYWLLLILNLVHWNIFPQISRSIKCTSLLGTHMCLPG